MFSNDAVLSATGIKLKIFYLLQRFDRLHQNDLFPLQYDHHTFK